MTPDDLPQPDDNALYADITARLVHIQPKPSARFYRRMANAPWTKTQMGGLSMQIQVRRLVGVALMTILVVIAFSIPLWLGPFPSTINSPMEAGANIITPSPEITFSVGFADSESIVVTNTDFLICMTGFIPAAPCKESAVGTITELESLADFTVIQPGYMPVGYIFYSAAYYSETQGISLLYKQHNDAGVDNWRIAITQQRSNYVRDLSASVKDVQIGNLTAQYESFETTGNDDYALAHKVLRWEQQGFYFELAWNYSGIGLRSSLTKEELIAIAESMVQQMTGSDSHD